MNELLEWELTECDINKDVKVNDSFHYTGLKIQVKHMDHLFCIYIKSMGREYRIQGRGEKTSTYTSSRFHK